MNRKIASNKNSGEKNKLNVELFDLTMLLVAKKPFYVCIKRNIFHSVACVSVPPIFHSPSNIYHLHKYPMSRFILLYSISLRFTSIMRNISHRMAPLYQSHQNPLRNVPGFYFPRFLISVTALLTIGFIWNAHSFTVNSTQNIASVLVFLPSNNFCVINWKMSPLKIIFNSNFYYNTNKCQHTQIRISHFINLFIHSVIAMCLLTSPTNYSQWERKRDTENGWEKNAQRK